MAKQNTQPEIEAEKPICFVIMPMTDPDGYEKGHFRKVYEDIFRVACNKAGYTAIRGDDVKQTNLIQLDILQKLIDSPMAICDLSSRNPNVLFELGLRQAFDKPTVLVQEIGTPRIFDISPLRYTEYRQNLKYRDVLEDQELIAEAIRSTKEANEKGEGINSIVSLLSLSNPATLKETTDNDSVKMMQILLSEVNSLRSEFRSSKDYFTREVGNQRSRPSNNQQLLTSLFSRFDFLREYINRKQPIDQVKIRYDLFVHVLTEARRREYNNEQEAQISFIAHEADRIFSEYVASNSNT